MSQGIQVSGLFGGQLLVICDGCDVFAGSLPVQLLEPVEFAFLKRSLSTYLLVQPVLQERPGAELSARREHSVHVDY